MYPAVKLDWDFNGFFCFIFFDSTNFWFQTRDALTPEEIYNGCYVNIHDNKNEIFDSLRNNPKVSFDGKCFSYKVMPYLHFFGKFLYIFSRYMLILNTMRYMWILDTSILISCYCTRQYIFPPLLNFQPTKSRSPKALIGTHLANKRKRTKWLVLLSFGVMSWWLVEMFVCFLTSYM